MQDHIFILIPRYLLYHPLRTVSNIARNVANYSKLLLKLDFRRLVFFFPHH